MDGKMIKTKQLKNSELPKFRKNITPASNICSILKVQLDDEYFVVDHIHRRLSKQEASLQNGGFVRGPAIDFRVNALLGKIENSFVRTGLLKEGYELSDILRGLADYLDKGPYQDEDGNYYVHPDEVIKPPKLMKDSYSKLLKALKNINYVNKIPEYPKSGYLTQPLEKLYNLVNLEPEYYKQ